jgi:glycosyltransferase involved in cell wall biosynthesis
MEVGPPPYGLQPPVERDGLSIVFVSSHAQPAGSERYLSLLLGGLPASWIRGVVVLQAGPLVSELGAAGYPVTVCPTGAGAAGIAGSARRLRRLFAAERPSLVHANGIKAALVSVLAAFGTPARVVWVKHDFSFDRSLARVVALRCALVVGVSTAATRVFGRRFRRKVRVVPNGLPPIEVDRERARAAVREALGPVPPAAVVCLVGRQHPMKGHHELIEIVPGVLEERPGTRFALVGGEDPSCPAYARALRERVAELGVEGAVAFLGHRRDATAFMAGVDLVAMPSVPAERGNRENFPFVALEAMAVGTPVVAYAEGGLPEALGPCGVLVPTGDREALGAAIVRVLGDAELCHELGGCGRARVRGELSADRMVEAMKACYREAAARS